MLVIEDNEADVLLIREAIEAANPGASIDVLEDGDEAVRFFDRVQTNDMACPDLVILDVNLPKRQGGEVLDYLRHSRRCRDVLVLVVSTSDSTRDREQMTELGANGYFRKPSDYDAFMSLGTVVRNMLAHDRPA